MPNDGLASVAVLAVSATVAVLPQFLPKLSDVHHSSTDSEFASDTRVGEVAVVVFFLGVGTIASSIAGSPEPLKASMLMSLFVVAVYETALRNNFGVVSQ